MAAAAAKASMRLAADEEPPIDSPIANDGRILTKNIERQISCYELQFPPADYSLETTKVRPSN